MDDLRSTDSYDDLFLACMLRGPAFSSRRCSWSSTWQQCAECSLLSSIATSLVCSLFQFLKAFCIANITVTSKDELKFGSLDAMMACHGIDLVN